MEGGVIASSSAMVEDSNYLYKDIIEAFINSIQNEVVAEETRELPVLRKEDEEENISDEDKVEFEELQWTRGDLFEGYIRRSPPIPETTEKRSIIDKEFVAAAESRELTVGRHDHNSSWLRDDTKEENISDEDEVQQQPMEQNIISLPDKQFVAAAAKQEIGESTVVRPRHTSFWNVGTDEDDTSDEEDEEDEEISVKDYYEFSLKMAASYDDKEKEARELADLKSTFWYSEWKDHIIFEPPPPQSLSPTPPPQQQSPPPEELSFAFLEDGPYSVDDIWNMIWNRSDAETAKTYIIRIPLQYCHDTL